MSKELWVVFFAMMTGCMIGQFLSDAIKWLWRRRKAKAKKLRPA